MGRPLVPGLKPIVHFQKLKSIVIQYRVIVMGTEFGL